MSGRAAGLALAATVLAGCGAERQPPSAGVRERPVLATAADEEFPAAAHGLLAWTEPVTAGAHPPQAAGAVFVRGPSGTRRLRLGGALDATGGFDGRTLVVQEVRGGHSRLTRIDLRSGRGTLLPGSLWEWHPTVSDGRVLFGRADEERHVYQIVLTDLRSGRARVLASVSGHAAYAQPGQVNGDFAVWLACPDNACRAFRYRIDTGETTAMPAVAGYRTWHVGPSVARSGEVYYGVGYDCAGVRLVRWRAGRVTTLARLPRGISFSTSFVDDSGPGRLRVLYDRAACGGPARADVYEILP